MAIKSELFVELHFYALRSIEYTIIEDFEHKQTNHR